MKKIMQFVGILAVCGLVLTGCGSKDGENYEDLILEDVQSTETAMPTATHTATITVKDIGTIELDLFGDIAPLTTANFEKLASEDFYDGLIFHRVISDFMIQGGDPEGTGYGGSEENITGEFKANGIENPINHKRGVISMARSNDFNSASSQFFIMHGDSNNLNGGYAAFGVVTSGLEVVDQIAAMDTDSNDKPITDVIIEDITVTAK